MKRKLMTVTIIASMIAASLTGCGSTGSTASTTTTTEAAATTETGASDTSSETAANDLNIMIETPVESLDPQIGQDGTSFEVIADFTDGLMQMDAEGAPIPAIAESYELSEDGLTYTFHLRDDLRVKINDRLGFYFEHYGYEMITDEEAAANAAKEEK